MPKLLKYVAQDAMDLFYQQYKMDSDFWTLDDFISQVGDTIASIYNSYYQLQYKELKGEKKDEVVLFDAGMLSNQVLKVKNIGGILAAKIEQPIMSFLYDQSTTGIQTVNIINPVGQDEVVRTTLQAKYQLQYLPVTNTIFFYNDRDKIYFINKGNCNINEVNVYFVPSMYPDAVIPDGIADLAIDTTVKKMMEYAGKTVIKETADQNHNKIMETEIDKSQFK